MLIEKFVIRIIIIIVIGILIMYISLNQFSKRNTDASKILKAASSVLPTLPPHLSDSSSLKDYIENALIGTKGTYGVVVKSLKTGDSYYLNENRVFESASLYKIWIMAEAFNQIENGKLNEDEVLKQDIKMLNEKFNIASKEAELTEGEITLTVKDAIEQMIIVSHNYASLLLSEKVRLSNVKVFLNRHSLNESVLGEPPKATPNDIALFFEKLYKGELANQQNTKKMIDILKKQRLNNKLPKYLPQAMSIAHKTGELGSFTHDAGIVFLEKGDYVIVVMSESDSKPGAEERISNISRNVYEYFKK